LGGNIQTRDRNKAQKIDTNKKSFMPNIRDSTEDASDGIYGALSMHGRCK
jgi:hypothetical protein